MKNGVFKKIFGSGVNVITWLAIIGVLLVLFIYGCRRYLEDEKTSREQQIQSAR